MNDRTEKATPKRRKESRERGQVARSMEFNSALVLLAAVGVLALLGGRIMDQLKDALVLGLTQTGTPELVSEDGMRPLVGWAGRTVAFAVGPLALACAAAGFLASAAQVRVKVTPKALKPSLKKLNPLQGLKRLLGPNGLVEAAKAILKTGVVGLAVFLAIWPELQELGSLVGLPADVLAVRLGRSIMSIALRAVAAMWLIAVADYVWQRRRHEKSIRMTKDEVKRESRQAEVPPEVRGAIRKRQIQQAKTRMLADVPTADVVVVNPTHFAVALRYDGSLPAPEVVARGADHVAAAIRAVAEEHGVPIVSNPPLARTLYRDVDLGRTIPEELFAGVAEVLAYVYRTSGRRRGPTPSSGDAVRR
jgi:flagellar biosynthetic protein FlhB